MQAMELRYSFPVILCWYMYLIQWYRYVQNLHTHKCVCMHGQMCPHVHEPRQWALTHTWPDTQPHKWLDTRSCYLHTNTHIWYTQSHIRMGTHMQTHTEVMCPHMWEHTVLHTYRHAHTHTHTHTHVHAQGYTGMHKWRYRCAQVWICGHAQI
jgi:hypothetical protein